MKILMFGTYPIVRPMHGGQVRAKAIYEAYVNAGFEVRYVGICLKNWYSALGDHDIEIEPKSFSPLLAKMAPEIIACELLYSNKDYRRQIKRHIQNFSPDIIHFEQSHPYIGIGKILKSLQWRGKIIYGSQNIEFELKRDILEHMAVDGMTQKDKDIVIEEVKAYEVDLTKRADLTIACTPHDASTLRRFGAKKVIIAKNGISRRRIEQSYLDKWQRFYDDRGINKKILFVGSGHPPNGEGFRTLVGYDLGFLPYDYKIMVAGGVSGHIWQHLAKLPDHIRETFLLRAMLLGEVDDNDLAALITTSDTIILPIISGGGSNLKTAEAILSGKAIVATDLSFRSYEKFLDLPNIFLAESKRDFRGNIIKAANAKRVRFSSRRELVTWPYALAGLVEAVREL